MSTKSPSRPDEQPAQWPAAPETVLLARRRAATLLDADRRVPSITRADVLLVVSELVSNAVRHGVGPVELELDVGPGQVHIEVGDQGPSRPPPARKPAATSQNGRGLLIVDAIASAWGVRAHDPGKTVWADIDLPKG